MLPKYHKDAPFEDPVLRCDSCLKVIQRKTIKKTGRCECGNRKFRNVVSLSFFEQLKLKFLWKVDKDFMRLFHG